MHSSTVLCNTIEIFYRNYIHFEMCIICSLYFDGLIMYPSLQTTVIFNVLYLAFNFSCNSCLNFQRDWINALKWMHTARLSGKFLFLNIIQNSHSHETTSLLIFFSSSISIWLELKWHYLGCNLIFEKKTLCVY